MKISRWVLSKLLNLKDRDIFSHMKAGKASEQHKGGTGLVSNILPAAVSIRI